MENQVYGPRTANIFAMMARAPRLELVVIVKCGKCQSENTKLVDHEHEIYECLDCGEIFERTNG